MTTIDALCFFEVLRLNVLLRVSLYSYWTSQISFLWLASFLSTFTQSVCWVLMSFRTKFLQLVRIIFYAYWLCLIPFSFYLHCVRWYQSFVGIPFWGVRLSLWHFAIIDRRLAMRKPFALRVLHACAACASTHLFLFKVSCMLHLSLFTTWQIHIYHFSSGCTYWFFLVSCLFD